MELDCREGGRRDMWSWMGGRRLLRVEGSFVWENGILWGGGALREERRGEERRRELRWRNVILGGGEHWGRRVDEVDKSAEG